MRPPRGSEKRREDYERFTVMMEPGNRTLLPQNVTPLCLCVGIGLS